MTRILTATLLVLFGAFLFIGCTSCFSGGDKIYRGRVTKPDGTPAADVPVTIDYRIIGEFIGFTLDGWFQHYIKQAKDVTDSEGRFEIVVPRKGEALSLRITWDTTTYEILAITIQDHPVEKPLNVKLKEKDKK